MKFPVFLLSILFFFSIPKSILAHPGRTAADGCHYCRTNCASWGEIQDARHCHGGSVIPPINTVTPKPTLKPTSAPKPTLKPTSTPKPTIMPTETPEPTVVPTPTPEVKGEATSESEQTVQPSPLVESDNTSNGSNVGVALVVVSVSGLTYYLYKRFKTKKGGEK